MRFPFLSPDEPGQPTAQQAAAPRRTAFATRWPIFAKFPALIRPYWGRFVVGQISGVLFAVCNNVFFPLAMASVANIALPGGGRGGLTGLRGSSALLHGGPNLAGTRVLLTCLAIPVVMLLRSAFSYLNVYCMTWVSLRVMNDLRERVFEHITSQSLDFFHESRVGQLINRVAVETGFAQSALSVVGSDLIKNPCAIIAGIAQLAYIDWKFTFISLVLFPLCIAPVLSYGRRVRKSGVGEEASAGMLAVILQETFAGIRVIKSFAREKHQITQFQGSSLAQFRNALSARQSTELASSLVEVVGAIGASLALFYVYAAGLSIGQFVGLITGTFLLYDPIKQLSRMHLLIQRCNVGTESIFALLDLAPTVLDAPNAVVLRGRSRGHIVFERVSFAYRVDGRPALQEVGVSLDPGKFYALVGMSGAGKSTFFALLQRFYDPASGSILLDGADVRTLAQTSLRQQIGVVTQDTFLFHDTVYNNILYGRLDATEAEVYAAALAAHAEEFIVHLPDGYHTVIGDRGCRLSGGQQQRLAIARALLKDAPILLLDEATSALDSESERVVQEALETLAHGRTTIAIAHRLSTIRKADRILVLENGRLVEVGNHRDLLAKPHGYYRRLYDLQFGHPEDQAYSAAPTAALL